jgi:hypothetical protein
MMGARKRPMIGDLVFDAQAAEPTVRQIDPDLAAEQALRADGEDVTNWGVPAFIG